MFVSLKMKTAQPLGSMKTFIARCEHPFFGEPTFHGINVNDIWFQQNSAACHTYHTEIYLFHQTYDSCVVRRDVVANRPPKCCYMIPLNYFLFVPLKKSVPTFAIPLHRYGHIHSKKCTKIGPIEWGISKVLSHLISFFT